MAEHLHAVEGLADDARGEELVDGDRRARFEAVEVGDVDLGAGGKLAAGDAARLTLAEGLTMTAGPEGAEVLVWEMTTMIQFG